MGRVSITKCKKLFGTVDDPEVNHWLLTDGTMLDFGEHPHWDVAQCMPGYKGKPRYSATHEFMEATKAIRVHYNSAYGMFIETLRSAEPSDTQKRILGPLCRDNDCTFSSVEVDADVKDPSFRYRATASERDFDPQSLNEYLAKRKKKP